MTIPIFRWWIAVLLSSFIKSFRCLTIPMQSRFICQASWWVNNTLVKGSKKLPQSAVKYNVLQERYTSASFCNCCVFCLKVCRKLFSSYKDKIRQLQAENCFEWLHLQKQSFAFCCVFIMALLNDLESGDCSSLEYWWWQSDGQSTLLGRESSGWWWLCWFPIRDFGLFTDSFKQIDYWLINFD